MAKGFPAQTVQRSARHLLTSVFCRHEAGAKTIEDLINELKGFYVQPGPD